MTDAGGSPDNPQQRINYSASFLGSIASPQSPTTLTALCSRAGLSGENLPLRVRRLEGGSDKVAAPEYKATLTITVTPLAARSEARRVGKEWVSTCRSRGLPES